LKEPIKNRISLYVSKRLEWTYLLELTDFLREFALILHVLDASLVEHIELLLEQLGLLRRQFAFLL